MHTSFNRLFTAAVQALARDDVSEPIFVTFVVQPLAKYNKMNIYHLSRSVMLLSSAFILAIPTGYCISSSSATLTIGEEFAPVIFGNSNPKWQYCILYQTNWDPSAPHGGTNVGSPALPKWQDRWLPPLCAGNYNFWVGETNSQNIVEIVGPYQLNVVAGNGIESSNASVTVGETFAPKVRGLTGPNWQFCILYSTNWDAGATQNNGTNISTPESPRWVADWTPPATPSSYQFWVAQNELIRGPYTLNVVAPGSMGGTAYNFKILLDVANMNGGIDVNGEGKYPEELQYGWDASLIRPDGVWGTTYDPLNWTTYSGAFFSTLSKLNIANYLVTEDIYSEYNNPSSSFNQYKNIGYNPQLAMVYYETDSGFTMDVNSDGFTMNSCTLLSPGDGAKPFVGVLSPAVLPPQIGTARSMIAQGCAQIVVNTRAYWPDQQYYVDNALADPNCGGVCFEAMPLVNDVHDPILNVLAAGAINLKMIEAMRATLNAQKKAFLLIAPTNYRGRYFAMPDGNGLMFDNYPELVKRFCLEFLKINADDLLMNSNFHIVLAGYVRGDTDWGIGTGTLGVAGFLRGDTEYPRGAYYNPNNSVLNALVFLKSFRNTGR